MELAEACANLTETATVAVVLVVPAARLWPSFLRTLHSNLVRPLGAHVYCHVRGPAPQLGPAAATLHGAFGSERLVLDLRGDESHEEILDAALGPEWLPRDPCMFHPRVQGRSGRPRYGYLPLDESRNGSRGFGVNRGLRGLYGQSRLYDQAKACEDAVPGLRYRWMVWTRADTFWMAQHPPVSLLAPDHVWIPDGCDNFVGLNDQHAAVPRRHFEAFFGRFRSFRAGVGDSLRRGCGTSAAFEKEHLEHGCIAERHLRCHLRRFAVPVARFLPVAAIARQVDRPGDATSCEELSNRGTGGRGICPGVTRPGCSHYFRDTCDGTAAAATAIRLSWGWTWHRSSRNGVRSYPSCMSGEEYLRKRCCRSGFGENEKAYHFCFGGWDPSYSLTEANMERCCEESYGSAPDAAALRRGWRLSQPMLVVLPRQPKTQWYCIPIGKWAMPHQLLCYCGSHVANHTVGAGGSCGKGGDYQELVVPRPTVCDGKIEFELKQYQKV